MTQVARTTGGLTIGELAARTGCTAEAIRYYEREGVVPRPTRAGSGRYRQYGDALAGVLDQYRGGLAVADCRILGALSGFVAAKVHDGDTRIRRIDPRCNGRSSTRDQQILHANNAG